MFVSIVQITDLYLFLVCQEFQSMLGASQTSMDGTIKTGKVLMDKSPEDDAITIEGKIADLKARWDAICALSVERYVTRILTFFCFLFIHTLLLGNDETLRESYNFDNL